MQAYNTPANTSGGLGGMMSWTPGASNSAADAYKAQQDAVAMLADWPRSKQLEAYRFLNRLGISLRDCDDHLIRQAFKKEQGA